MKRLISVILILSVMLSFSTLASAAGAVYGDADGDGVLSITDATAIQCHLAKLRTLPNESLSLAKVSGNPELSITDVTLIQKKLVRLIDKFPVEEQQTPTEPENDKMKMTINGTEVDVEWEDNEAIEALRTAVLSAPLTIQMSMYGGFEQVGSLGMSLPRSDVSITTEPGDVILYSGNQLVVFYGSNTWSYTRLGKITDKTQAELRELLSGGNVSIVISA